MNLRGNAMLIDHDELIEKFRVNNRLLSKLFVVNVVNKEIHDIQVSS